RRHDHPLGHGGVRRDDAARANMGAWQHGGPDGDHRSVVNGRADDPRIVAQGHARADAHGKTRTTFDNTVVLDVRSRPQLHKGIDTADHGAEPDARLVGHAYVAAQSRARRDENDQRPFHSGLRFSMKAETPSLKSSDM